MPKKKALLGINQTGQLVLNLVTVNQLFLGLKTNAQQLCERLP